MVPLEGIAADAASPDDFGCPMGSGSGLLRPGMPSAIKRTMARWPLVRWGFSRKST